MSKVKVQCPAKINLDLKVINKRADGFHNIKSLMQTINLYDYLIINVQDSVNPEIILKGDCDEIPYDKSNLVYKAVQIYIDKINIRSKKIEIFIEKNIPISAGLAGGSTDAAGTIFGLNILFGNLLSENELHELCSKLGSDLNVCLKGGCIQTSGRGEIIKPAEFKKFSVNLIKPLNLGISAKEAYTKFSEKIQTGDKNLTRQNYSNDLEWAIIDDYSQLQYIKNKYKTTIMTGSGSTFFSTEESFKEESGYWVKNGLSSIEYGVELVL